MQNCSELFWFDDLVFPKDLVAEFHARLIENRHFEWERIHENDLSLMRNE